MRSGTQFFGLLSGFWASAFLIFSVACLVELNAQPPRIATGGTIVYVFCGFVIVSMFLLSLRKTFAFAKHAKVEDRLRKQYPNEIEKWCAEWIAGRGQVDHEWLSGRDFLLHFGMPFAPMPIAFLVVPISEMTADPVTTVILVAGVATSLASLLVWAYLRVQTWRGRNISVAFVPVPLQSGQLATFEIRFDDADTENRAIQVRLQCLRRYQTSSSGPGMSTVEFTDTQVEKFSGGGIQQGLSVDFDIPPDALQTHWAARDRVSVRWVLRVRVSGVVPRIAQFVVPVL